MLIFAEKKSDVDDIHEYLLLKGVETVAIHGDKGKCKGCFFQSVSNQVILVGTLTGVQGDIRCKVLAILSTVNNLSWNWPDRRMQQKQKEVCSCYLFSEN